MVSKERRFKTEQHPRNRRFLRPYYTYNGVLLDNRANRTPCMLGLATLPSHPPNPPMGGFVDRTPVRRRSTRSGDSARRPGEVSKIRRFGDIPARDRAGGIPTEKRRPAPQSHIRPRRRATERGRIRTRARPGTHDSGLIRRTAEPRTNLDTSPGIGHGI